MKIVAIWMSYVNDSNTVLESVGCFLERFPDIQCVVVDDECSPMHDRSVSTLQEWGVEVLTSQVKRNGNLRGLAWCREQVRIMCEVQEEYGADWVMKVDPDVLVRDMDRVAEQLADPGLQVIGMRCACRGCEGVWVYGAACFYRGSALHKVLAELESLPEWALDPLTVLPAGAPEDITISRLVVRLFGESSAYVMDWDIQGGWLAGYQYSKARVSLKEYGLRFSCVSFGNKNLLQAKDKYAAMRSAMREAREVWALLDAS